MGLDEHCCDDEEYRKSQHRRSARKSARIETARWFTGAVGAFLAAAFLGLFVVHVQDLVPGGVSIAAMAAMFAVATYAIGVTFGPYNAGFLNPYIALMYTFHEFEKKRKYWKASIYFLLLIAAQFFGFVVSSWLSDYIRGSTGASLACVEPALRANSIPVTGDGFVEYLCHFLYKTVACHTFYFSYLRYKGSAFGLIALGALFGIALIALGPYVGGFFSTTLYLGVGAVHPNCFVFRTFLASAITDIVAAVLTWVLGMYVFTKEIAKYNHENKNM